MRKIVAAIGVVVLSAVGVPLAVASGASATPAPGTLDTAWTSVCTHQVPGAEVRLRVYDGLGYVDACVLPGVTQAGAPVPALRALCRAGGGSYVSRFNPETSAWRQSCFVAAP